MEAVGVCRNLSPEQLQFFDSQGYLVMESFASKMEVNRMMKRMDELLEGFDGSISSVFSTKNQLETSDNYFYESAENISFFFEENAFADDGCLIKDKKHSINKVGHALHEIDPVFKNFCCSDEIASLLFSLGHQRPVIMQSMYIFKQPGIGGEVVPHQDNSFLYTDPPTCKGLWLALEDATVTNGCLWAIPGSHKDGLARKFIRDENGVHFDCPAPTYDPNDFIPIEVKAGSMVVLHGDVVHKSFENLSTKSRHALSFHAVDTKNCTWSSDNWIKRKTEPQPLYAK